MPNEPNDDAKQKVINLRTAPQQGDPDTDEMPQNRAALLALERYLEAEGIELEPRTLGWKCRGRAVSVKRIKQALHLRHYGIMPSLWEPAIIERAEEGKREIEKKRRDRFVGDTAKHTDDSALRAFVRLSCRTDTGADRFEYYVAAWKQLMWQVKRKLAALKTGSDMMIVLAGPQGTGKSTVITHFATPLDFLHTPDGDFRIFSDQWRKEVLQDSYLIVLDEMSNAKGSDLEEIKRIITAEHVQGRAMHTQTEMIYHRNASFLAATNGDLTRILPDRTGMRRFVEMQFRTGNADATFRKQLRDIAAEDIWGCVSHLDDTPPAVRHLSLFDRYQAELVAENNFDTWFNECVRRTTDPGAKEMGRAVWDNYAQWAQTYHQSYMQPKPFYDELRAKLGGAYLRGGAVAFKGIELRAVRRLLWVVR